MAYKRMTTMVLKVDLQCSACYKKVKKILGRFPQIRDQVFDKESNTITISVFCCNPEGIRDKLCCKGANVIKSILIKDPEPEKPKKKVTFVDPPKEPEPPVVLVVPEPEPPVVLVVPEPQEESESELDSEPPQETEPPVVVVVPEPPKEPEPQVVVVVPEPPQEPEPQVVVIVPEPPKDPEPVVVVIEPPKDPEPAPVIVVTEPPKDPEPPPVVIVEKPEPDTYPYPELVNGYPYPRPWGTCCTECYHGYGGGPCYQGFGSGAPDRRTCCMECYNGYGEGPCTHGYGFGAPDPPQPLYEGYVYDYGGEIEKGPRRERRSRCDYYFSDENPNGCSIM